MRILLIEPCFENYGGYFRAFGMAEALSFKGIKVDLLLSTNKKFSLKIERKTINKNLTQYNLPRIYINFFLTGRILRSIIICFIILLKRYDLIHIFALTQFEANIPFLFAKLLRKKVVVDWDDYWTDAHTVVPVYKKFKIKDYLRYCEYTLQKKAIYATATSDFLMKELEKIGINNRFKIINGVQRKQFILIDKDEARKKLNIEKNGKIILTFGNTFFKERAIYLFRLFEEIYKLDNTIKLYFNYEPLSIIKEQCPEEKFNKEMFKNIINVGYLDKDKLSLYMGATDLILFAMGDTTLEKACFPTRIGTYLNGERVIVMNETNTEACNTLKKYNCAIIGKYPVDIAKKTVEYLNNKNLQKTMTNNVIHAKEELSWDNLVKDLVKLYKEVV